MEEGDDDLEREADEAIEHVLRAFPTSNDSSTSEQAGSSNSLSSNNASSLPSLSLSTSGGKAYSSMDLATETAATPSTSSVTVNSLSPPLLQENNLSKCFLLFSVERGDLSRRHALAAARAIDNEVFLHVESETHTRLCW